MGQQQLLLLVLATVIVGLATVAGIQAFDENQGQASQDALVQRGTEIGSNIKGLEGRPASMGGIIADSIDTYSKTEIANRLGYDHNSGVVEAEGAGDDGRCEIFNDTSGQIDIRCASTDAPQDVQVSFNPTADPQVTTAFGSYTIASQ